MMEDLNNIPTVIVITVEGKEYPLDCSEFTGREASQLKNLGRIDGIAEIPKAIKALDLEAISVMAAISMVRAGINIPIEVLVEKLLDAKMGEIKIDIPAGETEPRPT